MLLLILFLLWLLIDVQAVILLLLMLMLLIILLLVSMLRRLKKSSVLSNQFNDCFAKVCPDWAAETRDNQASNAKNISFKRDQNY